MLLRSLLEERQEEGVGVCGLRRRDVLFVEDIVEERGELHDEEIRGGGGEGARYAQGCCPHALY